MLIVVISLGATVFAFATGGFTSIGNSFQGLFSNSSYQVAEHDVIQQLVFVNSGSSGSSGFTIYVLNAGTNPSTIEAVYVQNVVANTFVGQFTTGTNLPGSINSGIVQTITVYGFIPAHGTTYTVTIATSYGNTVAYTAKYN
jgi:hypothetical protein